MSDRQTTTDVYRQTKADRQTYTDRQTDISTDKHQPDRAIKMVNKIGKL